MNIENRKMKTMKKRETKSQRENEREGDRSRKKREVQGKSGV